MIKVQNLQKTYDPHTRRANPVLRDINLTLPDKGFVCILGASGCGKTSLLNAIGGLDHFQGGTVDADGTVIRPGGANRTDRLRSSHFGYIFQNYYLLNQHSVQYNVYLGLHGVKMNHKEKLQRVWQVLEQVDMARFARRKVSDLSGGQQQRVAIARALAPNPRVIFADEPTGNLDESNTLNICSLLRSISANALVVMVTHEERLARFFADRMITLRDGVVESDITDWQREPLMLGSGIYTADYVGAPAQADNFELELYRQEDAPVLHLTVISGKDRIFIKTSDSRTVICSDEKETPVLHRGQRPVLTLEELKKQEPVDKQSRFETTKGSLPLFWRLREARFLLREKGMYRTGMLVFLALLTALGCVILGDWLTVSAVNPRDFVNTDSHVLEVSLERGENMAETQYITAMIEDFLCYLDDSGVEYEYLPPVSAPATYTTDLFLQLGELTDTVLGFSYIPIHHLSADTLIAGRMPERSDEIVVDRWVLDNYLKKDGVLQNGIPDAEFFIGKKLLYQKLHYDATIVGISDSGECAVYLTTAALASIGVKGQEVVGLSEFRRTHPGQYDDLMLEEDRCIVLTNNAGMDYARRIGSAFRTKGGLEFEIVDAFEAECYAGIVVADSMLEPLLRSMASTKVVLYCPDKAAMKELLARPMSENLEGIVQIEVKDAYGTAWAKYENASRIRANARTVVVLTVAVMSLAMLYLLRRSQIQKRIGMMAVYRLLGIPKGNLLGIFAAEAMMTSLRASLPAALLTWAAIETAKRLPSLKFTMVFGIKDALLVFLAVFLFCQLVSLLPALRILRRPPAKLASNAGA